MEKYEFLKRGVYRKVTKRKSPDTVKNNKKTIQGVQEIIGQLKETKPEKFAHENMRSRLRKSILLREVKSITKNVISSTPHHTKDPNHQHFFGRNFSILLSPIPGKSTDKNVMEGENKKNDKGTTPIQQNKDNVSNEVVSNDIKHHDHNDQKVNKTLHKSKRNQSLNRSKFENGSIDTVDTNRNKVQVDNKFNSQEHSRLEDTDKTKNKFRKSPTKTSLAQSPSTKKSRIPLRTASQEKTSEDNNNLHAKRNRSFNEDHKDKNLTPRKKANKNQPAIPLKPNEESRRDGNDCADFKVINESHHNQNGDEQNIITISSDNTSTHSKESNEDLFKKSNNISAGNNSKSDNPAEFSNDSPDHDRAMFINKTPRRQNNKSLWSQKEHSPVCYENIQIPIIITETNSQSEKPEPCNKSRVSALRCQQETRSIALSPIIGLNTHSVLHSTRLNKSVGVQLTPDLSPNTSHAPENTLTNDDFVSTPLNKSTNISNYNKSNNLSKLVDGIWSTKKAVDRGIQTSITTISDETEDRDKNQVRNVLEKMDARKEKNEKNETLADNRPGPSAKTRRRSKFICVMDDSPPKDQEFVVEDELGCCNTLRFPGVAFSDSGSSAGCGSGIQNTAYNYVQDNSRLAKRQIFESLEEVNTLDALDFSQPEDEQFIPHEESNLHRPWRFDNEGSVPEYPTVPSVQNTRNYLYDSGTSGPDLRHTASAINISKRLPRDSTLARTTKRHYDKRRTAIEVVQSLKHVISSPTIDKTLVPTPTAAIMPDNENSHLELGTECQSPEIASKQVKTPVSRRVCNKNLTLIDSETNISLSSADQQLLGIRPLSVVIANNKSASQLESEQVSADNNQVKNIDIGIDRGQQIQKNTNEDLGIGIQENPNQQLKHQPKRNGVKAVDDSDKVSCLPFPRGVKKPEPNRSSVKSRNTRSIISEINIISQSGERRPQRIRKPVRFLTDIIIIDENLLLARNKNERTRKSKGKPKKIVGQSKDKPTTSKENLMKNQPNQDCPRESCLAANSNESNTKSKRKVGREKKNKGKSKKIDEPDTTKKSDAGNDGVFQMLEFSQQYEEDLPESCSDKNLPSCKPVEQTIKNKLHSKGNSLVNTASKVAKRRNLTGGDSGFETINNANNTDSGIIRRSSRNKSEKDKQNADVSAMANVDHAGVANESNTRSKKKVARPNKMTDTSKKRDEVLQGAEFSQQLEEGFLDQNLPSNHKQVDNLGGSENMPPPSGSSIINRAHKVRRKRTLVGDSDLESTNNTINETARSRACKKSKKTKQNASDDTMTNFDHAPEELPISESANNADRLENGHSSVLSQFSRIVCDTGIHKKQNIAKGVAEQMHRDLQSVSGYSRYSERSSQDIDEERRPSQSTNNDYVNFMLDGTLCSLKIFNKFPSDHDYTRVGNINVTQPMKHPQDSFSCGHIRLSSGGYKRPTISTKYSLVYNVVEGTARFTCHTLTNTLVRGDFCVIPVDISSWKSSYYTALRHMVPAMLKRPYEMLG